jgi:hypothetical protein
LTEPDAGYVPYLEVERVVYSPAFPWPAAAPGESLQRRSGAEYGNDPVNWLAGAPGIAPPRLAVAEISAVGVRFQWNAVPGRIYRLQYRDEFMEADWQALPGEIVATGGTAEATDPRVPLARWRYYRVLVVE